MRALLTSLLCAFLGVCITAAEKPPRDFSAGFEKLCEMARIPDLTEAEPGRAYWDTPRRMMLHLGFWRLSNCRVEGPDWKLGRNPDGSMRVLLNSLHVLDVHPAGDAEQLCGRWRRQSMRGLLWHSRNRVRDWVEAEQLALSDDGDPHDLASGHLLLNAAALFAAGQRNEANELAGILLAGEGAERTVAGAYCRAAESCYEAALVELMETGDRDAFTRALQSTVERFPTRWPGLAGVEYMLAKLRVPGTAPTAVAALAEEDRRLVTELMSGNSFRAVPDVGDWLFFAPEDLMGEERNGPLARLLCKGVDAVPVLLALAEDSRLTVYAASAEIWEARTAQRERAETPERSPEEIGEVACKWLPHLLTGRQLAEVILAQIRPKEERRPWAPDREKLLDDTHDWYATYKGLSRMAMARKAMAESVNRELAILYLLSTPLTEGDFPGIEDALLRLKPAACREPLALLMKVRGEKAHPVVEKAIERIISTGQSEWIADQLKGLLPKEARNGPPSAELFLAELDKEPPGGNWERQCRLQQTALTFGGNADLAGRVLERAAASKEPMRRQALLSITEYLAYRRNESPPHHDAVRMTWEELAREPNPDIVPRKDKAWDYGGEDDLLKVDLKQYGPTWRKLLPQRPDDSILARGHRAGYRTTWFFARMYDATVNVSPTNVFGNAQQWILQMLPGGMNRQVWKRCQALLDRPDAALPPWHDVGSVEDARVDEIVAMLAKLSPEDARQQALALPDNEHLSLMLVLPKHKALATRLLLESRRTLPACRFTLGDPPPALKDALASFAGRRLSRKLAKDMLVASQRLVVKGQPFVARFVAGPGLNVGFEAAALDVEAKKGTVMAGLLEELRRLVGEKTEPGVTMRVLAGDRWSAFWHSDRGEGLDQTLVRAKDRHTAEEFEEQKEEEERERDRASFLEALDGIPDCVLLAPEKCVQLEIVALNGSVCERLKRGSLR